MASLGEEFAGQDFSDSLRPFNQKPHGATMTELTRRRALQCLGTTLFASSLARPAFGQTGKTIRLLVGFPPVAAPTPSRACWPSG